jgi:hypothetical protein
MDFLQSSSVYPQKSTKENMFVLVIKDWVVKLSMEFLIAVSCQENGDSIDL